MKTCPACQRTYSDESLIYCLIDGTVLSAPHDPNQTLVMPESRTTDPSQPRSEPPQSTILAVNPQNQYAAQPPIHSKQKRSGPWLWIALALVFAVLTVAVVIGALLWMNSTSDQQGNRKVVNGNLTNVNRPSPSPTVAEEEVTWEEHPNTSINEGERITYYGGTTREACQDDCLKNPDCRAYTFINAGAFNPGESQMCYLMSEVKTLNPNPGCYTGVKK